MTYLKQFSLALGLVAAAGVATPALANDYLTEAGSAPEAIAELVEAPAAEAPVAETAVTNSADIETLGSIEVPAAEASLLALPEDTSGTFNAAGIESALLAATIEAAPEAVDSIDLAQATGGTVGVSPAYIGVGGNIGIGNRGNSALSSFGFNVISKISLGPRFSVRPGATITNDRSGFTIPVTYNFNNITYGGFTAQPYVGVGAEIPTSGDVGLLVNAGADIPISPQFTLNSVANFRVTSGFALGISLGVGYNFPFFFN